MKTQAIIAAGGVGKRMCCPAPKAMVDLCGKPLFVHAALALEKNSLIASMILVVPQSHLKDFQKAVRKYRLRKVVKVVPGGATRKCSVSNGLREIDDDTDLVLIHDAARPMLTQQTIQDAVVACRNIPAAIVAVPVKPTIKRVDAKRSLVRGTLRRDELWEAQTPQVFRREIIAAAHKCFKGAEATDDAALVERLGEKVAVVLGEYRNIKVTTPDDLIIATSLLTSNTRHGL